MWDSPVAHHSRCGNPPYFFFWVWGSLSLGHAPLPLLLARLAAHCSLCGAPPRPFRVWCTGLVSPPGPKPERAPLLGAPMKGPDHGHGGARVLFGLVQVEARAGRPITP
ncbi:hypothetical protein NDU88_004422 [Pleurodeles waltl]|uniref:Uncharacterized protein n=1 Tax=Pleurodeles waltl TaxID=8319 RepID=A0AAV7T9N7_PLEWA|nr:hypothetical protein NDU88_004422 [Pleurodeles waltl]